MQRPQRFVMVSPQKVEACNRPCKQNPVHNETAVCPQWEEAAWLGLGCAPRAKYFSGLPAPLHCLAIGVRALALTATALSVVPRNSSAGIQWSANPQLSVPPKTN